MPDRWSLLFATLRGDQTIDTFDASISQLDRYIGRTGSLQATIPVPNAAVGRQVEPVRWGEGHTQMWAVRGNQAWWGGTLDQCVPTGGGRAECSLQVTGSTFEGYADRREVRETWDQSGVEQLELARMIWAEIQARTEGDVGIGIPAVAPSGQVQDYSVDRADGTKWGTVLSEIAGRANGFEWIIDVAIDETGTRSRTLLLGYPTIGRAGQPDYVITLPGDILNYTWPGDATQGGTSFQARGDADETDVTTSQEPLMSDVFEATDLLAAGWPLYDVTTDRPGVTDLETLDGWATQLRDTLAGSIRIPTVTARIDSLSPAMLGAQIQLRVTDELHPAQPDGSPGVSGSFRCVGYSIKAWERGTDDEVSVIFEDPTTAVAS